MSGSTINFRDQLKLATQRFLDALAPEDRVAVVQFDAKVKPLSGFTTDRSKTAWAIQNANGRGETHFYDAIKYALQELDKEGKRRKAIVAITDGLDTEMRNTDRRSFVSARTDEEALTLVKSQSNSELNQLLSLADRQGVSIFPLALPSGDPKRLPLPDPNITGIYAAARTVCSHSPIVPVVVSTRSTSSSTWHNFIEKSPPAFERFTQLRTRHRRSCPWQVA
jgi:hypothetical protein